METTVNPVIKLLSFVIWIVAILIVATITFLVVGRLGKFKYYNKLKEYYHSKKK
jgi:large-conductance mechanosensitive channel